jgi:creatinine amidohydrolase
VAGELPGPGAPRILEWQHLTGPALSSLDRARTVVLVSCSPLEVHGPHLPVFADLRESEGLLTRTAEKLLDRSDDIAFVRLPPLWVAADVLPHRGSIKFDHRTVIQVLYEMGTSLARQGFVHVWIGNFHGGPRHVLAIEEACHRVQKETGAKMISVFSLLAKKLTGGGSDLAARLDGIGGVSKEALRGDSHGGAIETALLLHLAGAHVDPAYRELPPRSLELDLSDAGGAPLQRGAKPTIAEILRGLPLKQRYYERETYAGAPALATPELGAAYLETLTDDAAAMLFEVFSGRVAASDCHSPLWPFRKVLMSRRIGALFDAAVRTRPSPV